MRVFYLVRFLVLIAWALISVFVLTAVLSLPACGQMGDLYLPDDVEQDRENGKKNEEM